MRALRRIHARDPHVYCLAFQLFQLTDASAWEPSPPLPKTARRVEEVKVVAVADARDIAVDTSLAKDLGLEVADVWDAANIALVALSANKDRYYADSCGGNGFWREEGLPARGGARSVIGGKMRNLYVAYVVILPRPEPRRPRHRRPDATR